VNSVIQHSLILGFLLAYWFVQAYREAVHACRIWLQRWNT